MSSTVTSFIADDSAPMLARLAVSAFLGDAVSRQFTDAAELLTTELVTNSITHAGLADEDLIGLDLDLSAVRLRVEVSDAGPGFEAPPRTATDGGGWGLVITGSSGWGLVLVDQVADRWGIISNRPSVVWFELDR